MDISQNQPNKTAPLIWAVIISATAHAVLFYSWQNMPETVQANTQNLISLRVKLSPVKQINSTKAPSQNPLAAMPVKKHSASPLKSHPTTHSTEPKSISTGDKSPKQNPRPIATTSQTSLSLKASVKDAVKAHFQTSPQPIECTPLQRSLRLLKCNETDITYKGITSLHRALDKNLSTFQGPSKTAMALNTRLLLDSRQQLNAATANRVITKDLTTAITAELRQTRHQIDAYDQQRSSIEIMGVVVDTYRASDNYQRNPNHFDQGRL